MLPVFHARIAMQTSVLTLAGCPDDCSPLLLHNCSKALSLPFTAARTALADANWLHSIVLWATCAVLAAIAGCRLSPCTLKLHSPQSCVCCCYDTQHRLRRVAPQFGNTRSSFSGKERGLVPLTGSAHSLPNVRAGSTLAWPSGGGGSGRAGAASVSPRVSPRSPRLMKRNGSELWGSVRSALRRGSIASSRRRSDALRSAAAAEGKLYCSALCCSVAVRNWRRHCARAVCGSLYGVIHVLVLVFALLQCARALDGSGHKGMMPPWSSACFDLATALALLAAKGFVLAQWRRIASAGATTRVTSATPGRSQLWRMPRGDTSCCRCCHNRQSPCTHSSPTCCSLVGLLVLLLSALVACEHLVPVVLLASGPCVAQPLRGHTFDWRFRVARWALMAALFAAMALLSAVYGTTIARHVAVVTKAVLGGGSGSGRSTHSSGLASSLSLRRPRRSSGRAASGTPWRSAIAGSGRSTPEASLASPALRQARASLPGRLDGDARAEQPNRSVSHEVMVVSSRHSGSGSQVQDGGVNHMLPRSPRASGTVSGNVSVASSSDTAAVGAVSNAALSHLVGDAARVDTESEDGDDGQEAHQRQQGRRPRPSLHLQVESNTPSGATTVVPAVHTTPRARWVPTAQASPARGLRLSDELPQPRRSSAASAASSYSLAYATVAPYTSQDATFAVDQEPAARCSQWRHECCARSSRACCSSCGGTTQAARVVLATLLLTVCAAAAAAVCGAEAALMWLGATSELQLDSTACPGGEPDGTTAVVACSSTSDTLLVSQRAQPGDTSTQGWVAAPACLLNDRGCSLWGAVTGSVLLGYTLILAAIVLLTMFHKRMG